MKIRRAKPWEMFWVLDTDNGIAKHGSLTGKVIKISLMLSCFGCYGYLMSKIFSPLAYEVWIVEEGKEKLGLGTLRGTWFPERLRSTLILDKKARGKGLGDLLLTFLIERAKARGAEKLVGAYFLENESSVALHKKHGFKTIVEIIGKDLKEE